MRIIKFSENPTIDFAAEELTKYLGEILQPAQEIAICSGNTVKDDKVPSIQLGILDQLAGLKNSTIEDLKNVPDEEFDDAIYIKVEAGNGVIVGINPRSVLLAVYRFLSDVGCNWVRPGINGESIPKLGIKDLNSSVAEKPSYRHRGICIEGANSYENIKDIIDWAPKVGFNSYFFQFREAFTFFDRYYSHMNNPTKQPESFTVEQAREYVAMAGKELEKRGMIHHAVGHGWTCEPFGIPGLEWKAQDVELSDDIKNILAEVDGKRELWKGVALNTNLCYSNDNVRKIVTEAIAEYLIEHPQVDLLHFWLADGTNNQCECDNCQVAIPSDFYVMMLNELDELLTEKKIERKIVFLIYVDLLWPPQQLEINNPDRFTMMYAPITRTYRSTFATDKDIPAIPSFERNKCKFPNSVEENLSFLKAWQAKFEGDSFDFDYHYMWAHYSDPGYQNISQILHKDLQNLRNIGLNGFVSCQTQRAFFPTGIGMHVMGRTLWNRELPFEAIQEEYFRGAFGEDSLLVSEYLSSLSDLFQDLQDLVQDNAAIQDSDSIEEVSKTAQSVISLIKDFAPIIDRNLRTIDKCIRNSWRYLEIHKEICIRLAKIYEANAKEDKARAEELWNEIKTLVQEKEDELQTVLDVYLFVSTIERTLMQQ
ncbi:MAG: DUF4838 domain-containing protein [Clostridiales bacterium]|nr:DUF4838 domain-containing protein [Clostridiales bacterium]